jgi:SAM-dependent methyltransferase
MRKVSLDVGCGDKPRGTVNCDLYLNQTFHRENRTRINLSRIPNFVKCDAQYLPFKSNCFEEVICSHLIEHVKNPYLLLDELMRVCKSKGIVYLSLPHRFSKNAKNAGHIHFFSRRWFENNLKYPFDMETTTWSPFGFFLFFPDNMKLKIYKRKEYYGKT